MYKVHVQSACKQKIWLTKFFYLQALQWGWLTDRQETYMYMLISLTSSSWI